MGTGKLFVTVFVAVLLANALTALALFGARGLLPAVGLPALSIASRDAAESSTATAPSEEIASRWVPAIQERIRQFWVHPAGTWEGNAPVVNVQLEPGGKVITNQVRIITSSGNPMFDQSVVNAIYDASPLPVPSGSDFEPFRDFNLVLRP
ncbi:MAG: energy transducer TonB [Lamprobacter sp.]|uniref:energy transducer TonB n=1 Tax=Lamprobacter sp. TaxID=3100796 RepID=UPI002B25D15E|nr:energy transducer TonB [Lamprobacter sp.]MEA3640368.1 energy transducer TonB [Lamprobacter sp.]